MDLIFKKTVLLTIVLSVLSSKSLVTAQEPNCTVNCNGCSCFKVPGLAGWGLICNDFKDVPGGIPGCLQDDISYLSIHGGLVDYINGTMFDNISKLEILEIENTILYEIDLDMLGKLPLLKQLFLPYNRFIESVSYPFSNIYLEVMDLSHNQFVRFRDNVLSALGSLKKLDVEGNIISDLATDPFTGLSSLEELILSNNAIETIALSVFVPLSSIRTIKLDQNKIANLDPRIFQTLSTLEDLTLKDNMLTTLSPNIFEDCTSLKTLDLSDNLFNTIPIDAFKNAPKLQILNMDQSRVMVLPAGAFSEITSLEEIKFSVSSSLLSVQEKAYFNMNQLEIINMTHNPYLSDIHPEAFHSATLGSLRCMYLSNNGLQNIEQQWFMDKYSLEYAEVHGNQLYCSCYAQWIRVNMEDTSIQWIQGWKSGETALKCYSPDNLRDMEVYSIDVSDFTCETAQILTTEIYFEQGNKLTLTAMLSRGLPSTQWILPTGVSITPGAGSKKLDDYEAAEERLANNSVLATFVVKLFDPSMQGLYILTASNAGGDINITYNITPDVPGYPSGLSGGQIAGIVIGVFLGVLVIVFVAFYCYRKRIGYDRMDDDTNSNYGSSSRGEAQHQDEAEPVTSSTGVSAKYGGTNEQRSLYVNQGAMIETSSAQN